MLASEIRNLTPEEVEARLPLLVRIARDIVETWIARRVLRERRRTAGRGSEGRATHAGGGTKSAPGGSGTGSAPKMGSAPKEGSASPTQQPSPTQESQELADRDEERKLTRTLSGLAAEVEQLGGALLDPSTGTLEFPSLLEGRLVMLSWRSGESQVRYYRPLDAPRGERKLLPGVEETTEDELDSVL